VTTTALFHIAFYQFVPLDAPEQVAARLRAVTVDLKGSILVAREGINGVLAGTEAALRAFEQHMGQDARFAHMHYKRSRCGPTAPFGRMKVHTRPEIVAVGLPPEAAALPAGGVAVSPRDWRGLIARDDVVVLDNRNSFEFKLGHFNGAVDPGVSHFRDFPAYVQAHADEWKRDGKRVAMYCTGGIRCDKLGGWMQHGLGLQVYQLDGGVLNYFQAMPDADADWRGECFVFDNRIALDTRLQETATTAEQVYAGEPDGEWRLQRARRLDESG
jgi:UPF0176 protein